MNCKWTAIGAAVVGSGHLQTNSPVQDRYASYISDKLVVIAVADGAGSALYSAEGAECAVNTAIDFLKSVESSRSPLSDELIKRLLREMIDQVHTELEQLAQSQLGCDIDLLATTLLTVVVTDDWVASVQIGDGGIVLKTSAGQLKLLPTPTKAEYINETFFITSSGYRDQAIYTECASADVSGFAVFTDGVEFLSVRKTVAHDEFFLPLFDWASNGNLQARESELREYLASPRVCARTNDDKTLVVAVRNESN
jgi:hypothetical protein